MTRRRTENAWWEITKADVPIWVVLMILALAAWWLTGDWWSAISVGMGAVAFGALDLFKRYLFRNWPD